MSVMHRPSDETLAAFAAGWLFGRFGGKRRRSDDERNARNITQAQKK